MELPVESLRRIADPAALGCATSEEIEPLATIIGQERAVRALNFGLGIRALGFNIFVAGVPGTGRTLASRRFLEELAKGQRVPDDCCYVYNFQDPYRPKALCLPAGRAKVFQADMIALIAEARTGIRRAFEGEEYAQRREQTVRSFQTQRDEMFQRVNEQALAQGFLIRSTQMGIATIPIKDGKPLSEEEFAALRPEEREQITRNRDAVQAQLEAALRQARQLEKAAGEALQQLDQQVALYALAPMFEEMEKKYQDLPQVLAHFQAVQADILENVALFRSDSEEQQQPALPFLTPAMKETPFRKYQVNVIVDNTALKGAPVVIELNPTYTNLFGRIEREAQFGALVTDFTMIREGSLHRANGGYLLMPAEEVLRNPLSWDSLKRALRNREIVIEDPYERLGLFSTKSINPEPFALDAKVILIGQPMTYELLYAYDEDFRELFKVKADFDTRMERTPAAMRDYVGFVCGLAREENMRHMEATALAKLIEFGSRLADDQEKLSTRFGELSDVVREASYYAAQANSRYIAGEHVKRAIDERFYRSSLIVERMQEMTAKGVIKIDVAGATVGQVNGLSVISLGDIEFGRPSRITASISLGQEGVIDIEREARLGGPIHTKGVLILSGYLAQKYAQDKPLSLSCRLVFEQSYSGVEGDSASSTELYAILSALSGAPIKQGIAVTGSVNQRGEVQAIGGVNQKIEGFFEACRLKGLSGEQGVMIPDSNVRNLMLREDVIEAVQQGKFHIWAVKNVDEGIEVLTGVPAGERQPDGTYPAGTINALVEARLTEMSEKLREFGKEEKDKGEKKEEEEDKEPADKPKP